MNKDRQIKELKAEIEELKKDKDLLVRFINHYARETVDTFGFKLQAPSILEKANAKKDKEEDGRL